MSDSDFAEILPVGITVPRLRGRAYPGEPKTPPKTQADTEGLPAGGTRPRTKSSHPVSFHTQSVEEPRIGISNYNRFATLLSLEFFRKHILPQSLSNKALSKIASKINVGRLKKRIEDERCKLQGASKDKYFEHISTKIYDRIVKVGEAVGHFTMAKINYGQNLTPKSLGRASNSKPDCYLLLRESSCHCQNDVYYCDIFAACEFKKVATNESRQDDYRRVIWTMRHILRDDPCRRFVFGVTIEDAQTRLWFANRSGVFVSDSFDYVENFRTFIEVLVRFTFAGKSDLGWDGSMSCSRNGEEIRYNIKVGEEWYRTVKLLSNIAAQEIEGRSTRVWMAENTQKHHVVVKDMWLDEGRAPEHIVQQDILDTADGETREILQKHLFTIVGHEVIEIGDQFDHTRDIAMRGLTLPENPKLLEIDFATVTILYDTSSAFSMANSRTPYISPRIHHRYHYRIVLGEVATPMYDVVRLKEVFIALRDSVDFVSRLGHCGWVHRDISAGNVYLYNGKGIVGDLEYAKIINSGRRRDVRTGTMDYWAVEVGLARYLFRPRAKTTGTSILKNFRKENPDVANEYPARKTGGAPFIHIPLHDVESLWWISIARIFRSKIVPDAEAMDGWDLNPQLETAQSIFPDSYTSEQTERTLFFMLDEDHITGMNSLHPCLENVATKLSKIRNHLLALYDFMEATLTGHEPKLSVEAYGVEALSNIRDMFDDCIELSEGMMLEDLPRNFGVADDYAEPKKGSRKRQPVHQPPGQRQSKISRMHVSRR